MGQRQATDCHEQRVARGVAALVVDALEVVDVDNEQAQRCAEPFRVDELASQLLLECAVVSELREAVEEGVRPSASVHLEQVGVLLFERLDATDDRCGHQREVNGSDSVTKASSRTTSTRVPDPSGHRPRTANMPTSTTNCNTTRATIRRRIAKPPSGSAVRFH